MSCNICCENFKSNRPKICCQYCEFEACRSCCEKYILSEEIPKCMEPACNKEWSRKYLKEKFTNSFLITTYKEHIESILFDKEKALLPATQPLVEEKIRKENIKKEIRNIDNLINDLQKQKRILEFKIYNNDSDPKDEEEKTRSFVRQCPANGCRGFLSTQWKCGLCEKWTCPDCHELKGFNRDCEHKCDTNSVETAKLLSSDSKPCPKCQSLIFKIEGCDQMWCTQCKTAFSWKTGRLETRIHNPHYYEWHRKNNGGVAPRNPDDIVCGRELNHNLSTDILTLARRHSSLYSLYSTAKMNSYDTKIQQISSIIRNMIHNTRVELPQFHINYFEKNQELRMKYLEKIISEDEFKIFIQRSDKKNRKNIELTQVINVCISAVTDIIHRFYEYFKSCYNNNYDLDIYINELMEIRSYCNNILRDIAFTYSSIQYRFNYDFSFEKTEKEVKVKEDKKAKAAEESGARKKFIVIEDDDEDDEEDNVVLMIK